MGQISQEKYAEMLTRLTAAYIQSPQTDNRSALAQAEKTLKEIIKISQESNQ